MSQVERPAPLTTTDFADRVMTAIRLVPAPTPTRTFVSAVRARALRDALATLWVAWHLGTVRSWSVAPRVRARSFALVLAVASVLASGSLVAAAAVHSVVPQRDDSNLVVAPSGSSVDEGPAGSGQGSGQSSQQGEKPRATAMPTPAEHHVVTTNHTPAPTDAGHHATTGDGTDATDDHHGSGGGTATDGRDGSEDSDDAHDGSDGGDRPAATDDHESSNDPGSSNTTDGHDAAGGGSSGSDDAPDSTADPESRSDGSGG